MPRHESWVRYWWNTKYEIISFRKPASLYGITKNKLGKLLIYANEPPKHRWEIQTQQRKKSIYHFSLCLKILKSPDFFFRSGSWLEESELFPSSSNGSSRVGWPSWSGRGWPSFVILESIDWLVTIDVGRVPERVFGRVLERVSTVKLRLFVIEESGFRLFDFSTSWELGSFVWLTKLEQHAISTSM